MWNLCLSKSSTSSNAAGVGQRPYTDGAFGLKVVQILEDVAKSSFNNRPPVPALDGTGRCGLMTPTAATVQSARSYTAHPLALVESNEIGESTRIWAFAQCNEKRSHRPALHIGEALLHRTRGHARATTSL